MLGERRFRFVGIDGKLGDDGWHAHHLPLLWRYNLHYLDELTSDNSEQREAELSSLLMRWIREVEPGTEVAWDPYPLSLRIVNIVKLGLRRGGLQRSVRASLAHQARWLAANLETHLLANHYFTNGKALFFAGSLLEGEESGEWRKRGAQIVAEQVEEQFLDDGGHYERSPMYQAILTEDLLDLVNLCRHCEHGPLLASLEAHASRAVEWLIAMCHPDGDISFFNDSALGVAPRPYRIADYANRLAIKFDPLPGSRLLRSSGYARLKAGDAVVLADAAPLGPEYQPGHGHADTLSFELSVGPQRVVVNSGISHYECDSERLRQRATAAHSTLVFDDKDSSEVWSAFRVGRRARPLIEKFDRDAGVFKAAHDGYAHLPGKPVHRRSWTLDTGCLAVTDWIDARRGRTARAYFHLHPDLEVEHHCEDGIVLRASRLRVGVKADFPLVIEFGSWHPRFGERVGNCALRIDWDDPDAEICQTRFTWSDA
ncbi:heparinase II/III family protein [Sphingomicrobium lutaoense]|uniref:Putative heparinase superfamily protein n=1 Tax=Sphingomicrobium lutaoense TaxID=515949 RepID=A0A839Z0D1_9SPHN|nr:heparinase II/III family protein [Sphingomicrobium lutaoense]MBB3763507.1 putative heparinase superfamily protein [Sphingomicrobium lutaoense]